jgi:phosphoribosyl-AMP cyclohydrolase / phosphoribosyl-ATP pyrophosphohydrolase
MIVPSIDIQEGRAVQLRGGAFPTLDLGDPLALAARLSRVGEIAVVDLDAARGRGDNRALVEAIARRWPARVGGGIRTRDDALRYLDAGARALMIGTSATPEFLSALPRERLIAALDARGGEVFVEGWTKGTGRGVEERMAALSSLVAGFLVTFIEREGRLGGLDLERARSLIAAAGGARVTFAGGANEAAEIAELDRLGADVQAGTAIAMGKLGLAAAFAAPLVSDRPDGLWPSLVCDEAGRALGLVYSDLESLSHAIETGKGAYRSRRRGLWVKGEESGDGQELVRVETDCDRDCLRFVVRQSGAGFCHLGTRTCFGDATGLDRLERTIVGRIADAPPGSYTRKLLDDPTLLASKLREEAAELAKAASREEVVAEAADLLYFALTRVVASGASLAQVEAELDRRSLKVTRRGGAPKAAYSTDSEDATWAGLH